MEPSEAARLLETGVDLYRTGDFQEAVEFLKQGLDRKEDDWTARLYLGMAYYGIGRVALARVEFRRILDECLDRDLRLKAASALAATNPEIKRDQF